MPSSPTEDMELTETVHERATYTHKGENEHLMKALSTDNIATSSWIYRSHLHNEDGDHSAHDRKAT